LEEVNKKGGDFPRPLHPDGLADRNVPLDEIGSASRRAKARPLAPLVAIYTNFSGNVNKNLYAHYFFEQSFSTLLDSLLFKMGFMESYICKYCHERSEDVFFIGCQPMCIDCFDEYRLITSWPGYAPSEWFERLIREIDNPETK
jgi:hypothetical protein